jgi:hypothetical protein
MSCDRFAIIHMRIRVARAAVQSGQCAIAASWLRRAAREFRAVGPRVSMNPCERVLAKSADDALVSARRELHNWCGRASAS